MKRGKEIVVLGILFCLMVIPFIFAETIESDEIPTNLDIAGGILCDQSGTFWLDTSSGETPDQIFTMGLNEMDVLGNCYREDGKNFDGSMNQTGCCPAFHDCVLGDLGYSCKFRNDITQNFCFDFSGSQEECEGTLNVDTGIRDGRPDIALDTAESRNEFCGVDADHSWTKPDGSICINITRCSCKWIDGACDLYQDKSDRCENGGTITETDEGVCDVKCMPDFCPKDECNLNGYKTFRSVGTVTGNYPYPTECTTMKEVRLSCESVTKLGFFNFINFIAAILIIALVYFIYASKNRHKK